jgi:glycosyltransferase involved in cell wall biosynthesis
VSRSPRSLSVIMPLYNEEGLVRHAVELIDGFLAKHFADHEIVIIESGSTDGSGAACDALARENPRVRVVHEGRRNGFGSAMRAGYAAASKELVCLMTADLPFPLESIAEAIPHLETRDCVLSFRSSDNRGPARKIQSVVYNLLVKTVLGLPFRHVNSAFKLFRREHLRSFELTSNGWLLDAELLYRVRQRGLTYIELPVPLIDRSAGRSSIRLSTSFGILKELARFLRRPRNPAPKGDMVKSPK